MAGYYAETYYPSVDDRNGAPAWMGDYALQLFEATSHGYMTQGVLKEAIKNAKEGKPGGDLGPGGQQTIPTITEKEEEWILNKLGIE